MITYGINFSLTAIWEKFCVAYFILASFLPKSEAKNINIFAFKVDCLDKILIFISLIFYNGRKTYRSSNKSLTLAITAASKIIYCTSFQTMRKKTTVKMIVGCFKLSSSNMNNRGFFCLLSITEKPTHDNVLSITNSIFPQTNCTSDRLCILTVC